MKPLRTREVLGPRTEAVSVSEDCKVQVSRGTEHPEKNPLGAVAVTWVEAGRHVCTECSQDLKEAVMFVLSVLRT